MLRGPVTDKYICDKFLEMMENKSCFSIKVTELIKYANIGRSTFYVHFDSIDDLIQKIEDDFLAGLPDAESVSFLQTKENAINFRKAIVKYVKKNANVVRAFLGPYGDPAFQIKVKNRVSKKLDAYYINNDAWSPNLSDGEKKLILEFIAGGRQQMGIWWILNGDEVSIEDFFKAVRKIMEKLRTFS